MHLFHLLNTHKDFWGENVLANSFWSPLTSNVFFHTMEVYRDHQLFGYQHSLKYHILCLAEEINAYRLGKS